LTLGLEQFISQWEKVGHSLSPSVSSTSEPVESTSPSWVLQKMGNWADEHLVQISRHDRNTVAGEPETVFAKAARPLSNSSRDMVTLSSPPTFKPSGGGELEGDVTKKRRRREVPEAV
jgi:hypothetical protein